MFSWTQSYKLSQFNMRNDATNKNRLTFVLPLALSDTGRDDQDLQRVRLLLRTFDCFFDKRFLEQFIIVTPDKDLPLVRETVRAQTNTLKIELVNEYDVCPELREDPDTTHNWPKPNKGWFRQQLIKLAIYERVRTPFYMTLDADVLFVRNFDSNSLIRNGKAALNVQRAEDFSRIYCDDAVALQVKVRETRYRQVERILRCKRNSRYRDRWYGETPVLLNRHLVELLANHIQETSGKAWRRTLLKKLPWTEYPLYFLFAEDSGALERYYRLGTADSVLRLSQSLWLPAVEYREPRDLFNWDPGAIFGRESEGVAVVVQSYLGYRVADVAERIKTYAR